MVLDEGFAWNGVTYRSLSQIAKAMTGTRPCGRILTDDVFGIPQLNQA